MIFLCILTFDPTRTCRKCDFQLFLKGPEILRSRRNGSTSCVRVPKMTSENYDFKPFYGYVSLSKQDILPGGTHIFGRTGMCRSNGSLFYKKSLNMGPVFYQKILKHGSTFLTKPKFSGFRMAKTPKIAKFLKNLPVFQEKSLKMGTLFC